jgi:hypothetical protein
MRATIGRETHFVQFSEKALLFPSVLKAIVTVKAVTSKIAGEETSVRHIGPI